MYTTLAEQEASNPLSEDRVCRLFKEQSFLEVAESKHTGGEMGEGSYLEHRLMKDPDIVLEALTPN